MFYLILLYQCRLLQALLQMTVMQQGFRVA